MQLHQQYCSEAKVPLPWCGPSMWKIDAYAVSLTLSFCLFLHVPKFKLIPGEQMQQCLMHMYIADLALRTLLSMTCPFYSGILPGLCYTECENGFPPGHSPPTPSLHRLLLPPWIHSHLTEGRNDQWVIRVERAQWTVNFLLWCDNFYLLAAGSYRIEIEQWESRCEKYALKSDYLTNTSICIGLSPVQN